MLRKNTSLIYNIQIRIISVFVLFQLSTKIIAQDPRFSQYQSSPFTINPSYIGKDVVDWRVAMNLRSSSMESVNMTSPNTSTISLEKNLFSNTDKTSQFGIGVMLLNDGGADEILRSNYVGLALAYNLQISENSFIGLGLSAHQANRLIDMNAIRFESQFGSDGFQNSIPSGEYNYMPNSNYWSLNQGLNYTFNKENWGYAIGASYFNSNKPMEGFFTNNKYQLKSKVSYQTKFWMNIGGYDADKTVHLSHLSEYQGTYEIHSLGFIYKHGFKNSDIIRSLNIGFYKRFTEKSYPYIGIETKKWMAGLSYDIPTVDKSAINSSFKSIELSFVLQLTGSKSKDKRYTIDNVMVY